MNLTVTYRELYYIFFAVLDFGKYIIILYYLFAICMLFLTISCVIVGVKLFLLYFRLQKCPQSWKIALDSSFWHKIQNSMNKLSMLLYLFVFAYSTTFDNLLFDDKKLHTS